jgi:hypothetical protein
VENLDASTSNRSKPKMNKNDYMDQKIDQMIDEALNQKREGFEKECQNPFVYPKISDLKP